MQQAQSLFLLAAWHVGLSSQGLKDLILEALLSLFFFDVGPFVEIVFWLLMALYFVQNMLRFPRKDFLCVQEKNLHPWWEEIPT